MTQDEIEDRLKGEVSLIVSLEKSHLLADQPFHELGVDSMSFIEIFVAIERVFNLKLIEYNMARDDMESIRSLSSFIYRHMNAG